MGKTIKIDPITRIEGHLAIKVEVENGKVYKAECSGEMFRGFENILKGRAPTDAQFITQRICGVCPISHGTASVFAQEDAFSITPPTNGRLIRNLILGANYIQSHIIHFYQLCALDFIDIAAITAYQGKDDDLLGLRDWVNAQLSSKMLYPAAPFLPRYDTKYVENAEINISAIKHYLEALEMRRIAHQAAALFCGKIPHASVFVPGGVTEVVTIDKIEGYRSIMGKLLNFVSSSYIPDVIEVAKAFPEYFKLGSWKGNYLAVGVFPENNEKTQNLLPAGVLIDGKFSNIDKSSFSEDTGSSYFSSGSGLHPFSGETVPAAHKNNAYSWLKAPRYQGKPMEVGPLARALVAMQNPSNPLAKEITKLASTLNLEASALVSALGRHAIRALEAKVIAQRCLEWISQLVPGEPTFSAFTIPDSAQGVGFMEAPRGALSHWIKVAGGKIDNYQCIVPTTWNCSPRDDQGTAGPIEQALLNTPVADPENPIEPARVVRSFDPCIACAVH
ncbi:MAG: nickel-dependent hydrogenase large subunit [Candidatus Riflebacteria bacterium]|nr:nickel-dependent hydrogenase large subunit [Candidatus Riflebacteria bacterium]